MLRAILHPLSALFRPLRAPSRTIAAISASQAPQRPPHVKLSHPMLRRKLFTLAAVASAVLCVALCVLWVRSRLVRDYGWAWLPWPPNAAGQRRWLKTDDDS